MISDFFLNATILISFLSISSHFFRSLDLNRQTNLRAKIIAGMLSGFLGIILMSYSVTISPGVIMDFRHIAIIQAAITAGPVAALISGGIIAFFRLFFAGVSYQSLIGAIGIVAMSLGSAYFGWRRLNSLKGWILGTIYVTLAGTWAISVLVERRLMLHILVAYWLGTGVVFYLVYSYTVYLNHFDQLYKQYKHESTKDYLTGLSNVREFDLKFNELRDRQKAGLTPFVLLYLDIDHFKAINDTFGHTNGDLVLAQLASILRKAIQDSDQAFRKGGEEFVIILNDCLTEQALDIAEHIREAVSCNKFKLNDGQETRITVSIGVSPYVPTSEVTDILELADSALYQAKHSGRNKVVLASPVTAANPV